MSAPSPAPSARHAPSDATEAASAVASWRSTLIVLAAALLVFSAARGFPFLSWDDGENVSLNALVRSNEEGVWSRIWSEPYAGLYVPLSYSVWRVLALVSGPPGADGLLAPDAALFHGANLLLHACNAWLVLRLLRRLVAHEGAAICGALLFALHPLQTESVAWVSELRGLLAAALGLVALERYLWRDDARTSAGRIASSLVALCAFAAALLAKPSAVVFPLLALILERFWLERPWRRVLPGVALGGALALGAIYLAQSAQSEKFGAPVPWSERPRIALDALSFYVAKLAWPFGLAPDYGRTPARVLQDGAGAWRLLIPLALAGALAASRARRRTWLAAALFVAALLPVLGLVPFAFQKISTVGDRYAYVALLGPALFLAQLARQRNQLAPVACGFVITISAVISWRQTQVWSDSRRLFEHTLEVNPASYKAWSHVGLSLGNEGRTKEAIEAYERCLAIQPEHQVAHLNLAILLQREGRAKEALPHFEAASRLKPSDTSAHQLYAVALLQEQRTVEARAALSKVLALTPNDASAHDSMATAWLLESKFDEAASELERAVSLRADAGYLRTLAAVRVAQGRHAEALPHLRAALALRPEWIAPMCDLASILAGAPDASLHEPAEALELAQRAVRLSREQDVHALEVLAAILARAERVPEAIAVQEKALARARAAEPGSVEGVEQTLRNYRAAAQAPPAPR